MRWIGTGREVVDGGSGLVAVGQGLRVPHRHSFIKNARLELHSGRSTLVMDLPLQRHKRELRFNSHRSLWGYGFDPPSDTTHIPTGYG